jgi:hypothetical protein
MSELLLDDHDLLQDRLVRSLHRNNDGHLAESTRAHTYAVDKSHNAACIYLYTYYEDFSHSLRAHYVYSHDALTYQDWHKRVREEVSEIVSKKGASGQQAPYGWLTTRIPITPMRNGDLFIKVDASGATGVRLTFNPAARKRKTHHEKKN